MTREEIIDFCEMKSQLEPENEDIFNYIIQTLGQEPCADCISRADALSDKGLAEFHFYEDYVKMRNYLKGLPPVTPTRKKGKWLVLKDEYGDIVEAVCSCCEDNGNHKWKYCHTCGAEMEYEDD